MVHSRCSSCNFSSCSGIGSCAGEKGKEQKDPKMIEPTQQEQASEIPTETEEVFDYSATETAETKSLPKSVVSKQGILIDVDAGTILAGKDALKRMIPASMTKIFTVLVAAENIKPEQLDELVTISIDATDFSYSNDCSNTGYEVDEQVTVRDLFYGTILPSGADSAVSLATYVAGSQEAFVDMMNQELEKWDCRRPHILPTVSAYTMMTITVHHMIWQ